MATADEWFEEWWARLLYSPAKRKRALDNDIPRPEDAPLWRERAYDAETDALLAVLRANRGRGSSVSPRGTIPAGSEGAVDRLLSAVRYRDVG